MHRSVIILALIATACATAPDAGGDTTTTVASTTTSTTSTTSTTEASTTTTTTTQPPTSSSVAPTVPEDTMPPVTGEAPDSILDPILADAADRTGVAVDDLVVVRSEFVEWPDGSLGCPEPGMVYTQVITPGYWVVIDAGVETLDYRAGRQGSFRLCENPDKPVVPEA